jgi:Ca2+-dependent lipid-binding protein
LIVYIGKAESLPKTDTIGNIDPYFKVAFGGYSLTSEPISNNANPEFFSQILIPFNEPGISKNLKIIFYDQNSV